MNSSKGRKITRKGSHHSHGEGWLYPWCGDRKFAKKEARRAQRRNDHKEITEQLKQYPEWIDLPPVTNMFSPIPIWLMSEWEKEGMEWFRELKGFGHFHKKGVRSWYELRDHQILSTRRRITTDETLFEDLKRSVNQYAYMKSAKEGEVK